METLCFQSEREWDELDSLSVVNVGRPSHTRGHGQDLGQKVFSC